MKGLVVAALSMCSWPVSRALSTEGWCVTLPESIYFDNDSSGLDADLGFRRRDTLGAGPIFKFIIRLRGNGLDEGVKYYGSSTPGSVTTQFKPTLTHCVEKLDEEITVEISGGFSAQLKAQDFGGGGIYDFSGVASSKQVNGWDATENVFSVSVTAEKFCDEPSLLIQNGDTCVPGREILNSIPNLQNKNEELAEEVDELAGEVERLTSAVEALQGGLSPEYESGDYIPAGTCPASPSPAPLHFRSSHGPWTPYPVTDSREIPVVRNSQPCTIAVSSAPGSDSWSVGVHKELTTRAMEDGEEFIVKGSSSPWNVGVGLCIEKCDMKPGIRYIHDCVGFYGNNDHMWSYQNGKEVSLFKKERGIRPSKTQGIRYNEADNCVVRITSKGDDGGFCYTLPDNFRGKKVRAVAQTWYSSSATIVGCEAS